MSDMALGEALGASPGDTKTPVVKEVVIEEPQFTGDDMRASIRELADKIKIDQSDEGAKNLVPVSGGSAEVA